MYKKLGIGSQQELFSRYIDSISLSNRLKET